MMRELHSAEAPTAGLAQSGAAMEDWLASLTQTYHLTDLAARRFTGMDACRLVVATSTGIYRMEADPFRAVPVCGLRGMAHDEFYTTLISTPSGALACVSSRGKFILIDPEGIVSRMRQVSASALHMTHTLWQGKSCFFLSGQDKEVRILDAAGDLMARFSVSEPILSLAAHTIDGELWLAGSVRHRNQVYVWNISRVMQGRAGAPVVLRGGPSPARMVRFIVLGERCWLAHCCWDGRVYLYPGPWQAQSAIAPAFTLRGTSALHTIEPLVVRDAPYLFGGAEDGHLLAWALSGGDLDDQPAVEMAQLNARVTCLASASVAGQPVLFAGCGNGRLAMLKLPRVSPTLQVSSANVGQGPVCGIGFTWPVEDEMVA